MNSKTTPTPVTSQPTPSTPSPQPKTTHTSQPASIPKPKNPTPQKANLLWMDLEMTGLDPNIDRIMEVACIATDWQLHPLAEYTATIKVPEDLITSRMVGDFWENNPDSYNSLVSQNPTGHPAATIERELLAFIKKYFSKDVYLAGNSIHQDRKFIDHEWPTLSSRLHYRMLDVSAWKIIFENLFHRYYCKPEDHRALGDIHGSIEEFQFYLSYISPYMLKKFLPDFTPMTAAQATAAANKARKEKAAKKSS